MRDRGRQAQTRLWRDWGGSPTTNRLRWRDNAAAEVARLHERITRATGIALPDAAAERDDPASADARYDEAVDALRELTRDPTGYALVFAENVQYGWRRNCYGLRPTGIVIATVAMLIAVGVLGFGDGAFADRFPRWALAFVVSAGALAWWMFIVSDAWVRTAAERYADALLDAPHALSLRRPADDR